MMKVDNKRRLLLRGTLGVGALAGAGLLAPRGVLAAWSKEAFSAKSTDAAMNSLLGGTASASDAVSIKAPDIAENGAVLPITDVVAVVKSGGTPRSATKEVKVTIGGCGG